VRRIDDAAANSYWQDIREHSAAFFNTAAPLWRLSIKSTTPPLNLGAQSWNGTARCAGSRPTSTPAAVRDAAAFGGGHATLFRGGDKSAGAFHPLPPTLMTIQAQSQTRLRSRGHLESRPAVRLLGP